MRLDGFTKIAASRQAPRSATPKVMIRTYSRSRIVTINAEAARQSGLKSGDKVDLYGKGSTFALEKSPAGMYKYMTNSRGKGGRLSGGSIALEISSRTNGATEFDAWVVEGILFFKPEEKEND